MSSAMIEDDYRAFLATKRIVSEPAGFDPVRPIPSLMKGHQWAVCKWNIRRGRSADFMDTGTGKSLIELTFADHIYHHTGKPVLFLTPLAVGKQMVREAAKFNIDGAEVFRLGGSFSPITISNYEKLHHFSPADFSGIVLDESAILRSFDGSTRKAITAFASALPFRLAATATPAPNDLIELTNHAEFLDIMTGKEIISQFFTQDGNTTQKWRLKKHAREPFWRWMASWSVAIRKPSDIGHSDEGYILPELRIHQVTAKSPPQGPWGFVTEAGSLQERRAARRDSLPDRVRITAEIVNSHPGEPFIVWRKLLAESDALRRAIPGSVEIRGSNTEEERVDRMEGFLDGSIRVIITDPTISGFGLNLQHCCKMVFVGLDDSFYQQYQAIRRCWRFGQIRPVDVYLVCSEAEGSVLKNLKRKEAQATEMFDNIVRHMAEFSIGRARRDDDGYDPQVPMQIPSWLVSGGLNS